MDAAQISHVSDVSFAKRKRGAIFGVKQELHLPVRVVGEGVDDLEVFDPEEYVERLFEEHLRLALATN